MKIKRKKRIKVFTRESLSFPKNVHKFQRNWKNRKFRFRFLVATGVIITAELAIVLQPYFVQHTYALGDAGNLLPAIETSLADKLKYNAQQDAYVFNSGATPAPGSASMSSSHISALIHKDPSKGVSVSDSMNKVDFGMTPKFKLMPGKQDGNRIVYPLPDGSGWMVYTVGGVGVKEDLLLDYAKNDTMTLNYTLNLGDSLEARLGPDGSIGVYGNKLFSGNISAGTSEDAALLKKARENAVKDTHLFSIPKPVINEKTGVSANVSASYELHGKNLKINVKNLMTGNYPLSIDPSIYVVTAAQFMYGNNETNINFDIDNKMIRKGRLTGARFDSWQNTANLPIGSWGSGSVAADGYIYQVGGASFSGQVISTQGATNYVVPSGVTSIDVKMWGGGGGGGQSSGGSGGGGGYVEGTIAVTAGETLNAYVGGGGGTTGTSGGGGGGFSNLTRQTGSVRLLLAGGGGGGGQQGGAASAGGGGGNDGSNEGVDGSTGAAGGKGGTQSAGGAGGTSFCNGQAGASLNGGDGAFSQVIVGQACTTGGGGAAGAAGGGAGGDQGSTALLFGSTTYGGGGGGSGYFGGGGGGTGTSNGGGGGGGSSYINTGVVTASSTSPGAGTVPGNSTDPYRGSAGNGGGNAAAGSTGLIVISTNAAGNPATKTLNWAKFDPGNGTVINADPGNGACSGWCTTTTYDMPGERSNFSLVSYNGYLYAIGGNDDFGPRPTSSGHKHTTVYVAKLGANGEPRLWNPNSTDPTTWTYWHTNANALPDERINGAAVAYNNKMYFIGGLDDTLSGSNYNGAPQSTVWVANILPSGKLGTWSASTALTSGGGNARYGMTGLVYNDRIYIVGGSTTFAGAPTATVYYIKINSDGTLASSWVQTSSFTTGRLNMGGTNAVVWGGYLYVTSGCTTMNASGICTAVAGDTQLASINADGTLDAFSTISGLTESRMGFGMLAWRDNIYVVGGCTSQDATSGACLGGIQAGIDYGHVNATGDVSSVTSTAASGAGVCTGGTPTNCNLPGTASVGNHFASSIIANGYLYVMGGCTNATCTTTSTGVVFTGVSSNGSLVRPAACPTNSTATNGWCVMNAGFRLNTSTAGGSPVVFNGVLYLVGGFSSTTIRDTILRAALNADGTMAAWTSQSLTGASAIAVSNAHAVVRANPGSAGSNPGNLYIMGGCTAMTTAPTCTTFTGNVYKCNIDTAGVVVASSCSTTSQGQIGTITGASGAGIAAAGGTVYGDYIYLAGGSAPGVAETSRVRYAKIDSSNNLSSWTESSTTLATARRNSTTFSHNGYLYVVGGYNTTSGILSDINFIKLSTSDGSLDGAWAISTSVLSAAKWGLTIPVSNGWAYAIGGCITGATCSATNDTINVFHANNNDGGGPASYATGAQITTGTIGSSAVAYNGYLYVAGGCSTINCSTVVQTTSYALIGADGSIGAWATAVGNNLPAARAWGKLLVAGGTLYYAGGQSTSADTSAANDIYYFTGTGSPTWSSSTEGIRDSGGTAARTKFGAAVWNNRMYIVGGTNATPTNQTTVLVSPDLASGGNITSTSWTSSTAFNVARIGLSVAAYANNLYILGGNNGTNYLSDVQYSKIDTSNGTVGSWAYSSSLPAAVSDADAFAANGYIYLIGGRSASATCRSSTLFAPILANTSGDSPTGVGTWQENGGAVGGTSSPYSGARFGAATTYYDGRAYVMNGGCSGLVTTTDKTQITSLLVQPQVAKYSISFDTDTDVYPSHWLANGYNSYSGAKWTMKYRSMTDPLHVWSGTTGQACSSSVMSDWGQQTSYSSITLGKNPPDTYTPLDGSGANTNCARYFYFSLTADDTLALSFPEDVTATHGPSITDLTLRYSGDPSKRLMHGRTFVGGLQMPNDTPYYAY